MDPIISGRRIRLSSSMFIAMTYDHATHELELELHDGQLLRYLDIPLTIARAMHAAESHGRYFHQHIRYRYDSLRLLDIGARETVSTRQLRRS
jgi:hypothetical protein